MNNMESDVLGQHEYLVPVQYAPYEGEISSKNKFDFVSKIFSSRKKQRKLRQRSPFKSPRVQTKRHSPQNRQEKVFVVPDNNVVFQTSPNEDEKLPRNRSPYNVVYIESNPVEKPAESKENATPKESSEKEQILEEMRRNKTYFELVKVVDRGTNPCKEFEEEPKVMVDKGTDTIEPEVCQLSSCEKEKEKLSNDIKSKEEAIKACLSERVLLVEDIEKVKKHLSSTGKMPDIFTTYNKNKQETPRDIIHLSRSCFIELGKHVLSFQKQMDSEVQKLKSELITIKKEKIEKEGKIKNIEKKLEVQTAKVNQEDQDTVQLQLKIEKIQDSLEIGKKLLRETEKSLKGKIEKLELELATHKQSSSQLSQVLDGKTRLITQLEANIDKLETSLESSKQQIKDIHYAYKSKVTKLESEHTSKITSVCENQTATNKQLSQALDQSTKYVNQIQETKKENTSLLSANKLLQDKIVAMEKELIKVQERCSVAERKLSREAQEVFSLRSQVEKLEALKEEELLCVDGDMWCQIMYQQDQSILDDLRTSLRDKEENLENLRAQGDCALRDFEMVQKELQQRRQQFNDLKDVFLDFEKKRDSVVREQRDFYSKMVMLSRRTIPRERFFSHLIEECQLKTYRIEELEESVQKTDKIIEETKRISDAQLKAMQAEMKFTAQKLYDFENHIRVKEVQLQDVIRVFEQEKKNKITAEEAMNTYKILLDDSKRENGDLRNKLNYLEDLEKNRTNTLRTNEELAQEIHKRQETETKLKNLERDLLEMKTQLTSKDDKLSSFTSEIPVEQSREFLQLKRNIQDLAEDKRYLERILMESQRSKEALQKDHEELYKKMRHAVRVMVESKGTQETMELKLEQRRHCIQELQKSQAETEDRLDLLKDVIHDMQNTIEELNLEREELNDKLENHMHCKAERAVHQELKLLQRDKAIAEEQHIREKEMLLHRLKDNEETMKEQHKHLRIFQEQLDSLNEQMRDTKAQSTTERHNHTQQLLALQGDKKKLELYIQELETRLAYETQLRQQMSGTMTSSPKYFTTSDSYDVPIRDHNKHHHFRK